MAQLSIAMCLGMSAPVAQLAAQKSASPTASRANTKNATGWTVKPEWVKAHEDFLASDVLHGRGSATRDEHLAATYVASEFVAYGLKTAPGMTGYIQTAELESQELSGDATITAGSVTLKEGTDFRLLMSSATSVSGPLTKAAPGGSAAAPAKGAVILFDGNPQQVMAEVSGLRRREGAVLLVDSPAARGLATQLGGKTRVPVSLKGAARQGDRAVALLTPAASALLSASSDGTPVTITVHVAPQANPRATYNAVGYLPGTDPTAGTILLSSHLDHLGIGRPVNGDSIYNGANDDAAGTTAVMELAHALAAGPRLRRSVLFVCYGSEESGGLGSTYFGEHPPVPLDSLVANIEFEMIGTQDPKMPKGVLLFTGWERSNLGPALKAHGALLGPDPYPEEHFFQRSDNYSLALMGVVAHTAAGWGTPPTYHQPDDEISRLNIPFMTSAIQSLIDPLRWLASGDFKPAWNPGGRPERGQSR
jgi:hypothetical protein